MSGRIFHWSTKSNIHNIIETDLLRNDKGVSNTIEYCIIIKSQNLI